MARTKAEVRAFLDKQVGTVVVNKPDRQYDGQCVTLIKALMEFLGVNDPYRGRGNAKDVGDALIREGIGTPGRGWLTVVVNRDMGYIGGVRYGHIWVDLQDEANYESNGNRALYTTKNTRPLSQGQQLINLDKWIGEGEIMDENDANAVFFAAFHRKPGGNEAKQWIGQKAARVAQSIINQPEWLTQNHFIAFFQQREKQLNDAMNALNDANAKLKAALDNDAADKKAIADAQKAAQEAADQVSKVTAQYEETKANYDAVKAREDQATDTGNAFLRWLGKILNGGK